MVKRLHSKRAPYSAAKKLEVLSFFERERTKGTPNTKIIEQCGVSAPTLYRWIRETNVRTPKWRNACRAKVDKAIATLVDPPACKWQKLEAIFTFCCWLHWPASPEHIPIGVASMVAQYAMRKDGATFASELPDPALEVLNQNLLLHSLGNIASGFDFDVDVFQTSDVDRGVGQMIEVCVEALLLLARDTDRRMFPSIRKLVYLMRSGALKYIWTSSRNVLQKLWRERLPSAPFLYVSMLSGQPDWALYPDSHLFVEDVDTLLSEVPKFPKYFGRCKAVVSEIDTTMLRDDRKSAPFPRFPRSLPEIPVDIGLTDIEIDAIKTELRSYRSADK